jgi:hypothetical protein
MHLTVRNAVEFVAMTTVLGITFYFGKPGLIAMKDAQLVDLLCNALMFILPVMLVLAFGWRGVIWGTLAVWGLGYVAGEAINALDPTRAEGGASMLDHLWIMAGWIAGLLYSLVIMVIRLILQKRWYQCPSS